MNKLEKLIVKLCPNGIEYKNLGEIATISRGGNFQKKDYAEQGIPCIHYGQIYTYYGLFVNKTISFINKEIAQKQKTAVTSDIIMAVTSENIDDVCKCIAWLGEDEIAVSGHTAIIHHSQNPKYMVYYFRSSMFYKQKTKLVHGTKVIEVTPDKLANIIIPVPPIEVQHEIVRILDNFTELTMELITQLTVELTTRKKQYEYYRELLFSKNNTHNTKWYNLSEIADIGTGSSNTNEGLEEGKYPFYVRSQEVKRKDEYEFDEIAIITAGDGVGVGKVFHYVEGKYALHQRAYRIHINIKEVIPKYFYHYMKGTFLKYIEKNAVNSSVTSIRRRMLDQYPVSVPTMEVQQKIVNVLDNFDSICTDLNIGLPAEIEARKKQCEYYRDMLLTFVKTGDIISQATSHNIIKLLQYVFGVVFVPLGDVANVFHGEYITKKDTIEGNIPVILGGQEPAYYINKFNHVGEVIVISRSGISAGFVSYWNQAIFITDGFGYEAKEDIISSKYLYYVLKSMEKEFNNMKRGAGVPHITGEFLQNVKIPVPIHEEQNRIVEILDHFDMLCNNLTTGIPAEIKARQKQYEYYRDKLLTFKEIKI